MANTTNFNLPLLDGSMTADVPRDMNALAEAVDTNVKAAIDNVTVPDASTTQKGIVQLSSATNSTAEDRAATPKAVKAAYDLAVSKQDRLKLIDNFAASNSPIDIYPEGESFFIATVAENIGPGWLTAALGDPGSQYCMVITYRSGAWGFQTVQEIYIGASSTDRVNQRRATRVKRDSNSFWQPFVKDFDTTGGTITGPTTVQSTLYAYGTVTSADAVPFRSVGPARYSWVVHTPDGDSKRIFIAPSNTKGQGDWNFDQGIRIEPDNLYWPGGDLNSLKSSVSNGKNAIASAITGKGGTAAGSYTFDQLAAAIRALPGRRVYQSSPNQTTPVFQNGGGGSLTLAVNGLGFTPSQFYALVRVEGVRDDGQVVNWPSAFFGIVGYGPFSDSYVGAGSGSSNDFAQLNYTNVSFGSGTFSANINFNVTFRSGSPQYLRGRVTTLTIIE
jgi:hypothetical protein